MRVMSLATMIVAVMAVAQSASATIVTFSDRATWTGAVGGAPTIETLESFVTDTEFRTAPVGLTGMTIVEVNGPAPNFPGVNFIDTGDSQMGGNVNILGDVGGNNNTKIRIDFAAPTSGFGADFIWLNATPSAAMDLFDTGGGAIGSTENPAHPHTFWGFTSTTAVDHLFISYVPHLAINEVFNMDDLSFAAVPEPTTLAIWSVLGGGLGVVGFRRRRKRGA